MASKSYMQVETATEWTDSGGDKLMDLGGLAADGVVCGAYLDLGAAPRADLYEVEILIDGFDTAPVVGQTIALWFTQSNATTGFDGRITTDPTSSAEGTATAEQASNCLPAGGVRVYSTTAADELQSRRVIRLTGRYVAPIVINHTADALLSTSDSHKIILTPIPQEAQ